MPDYVKRISTADIARGDGIAGYQVWPTSRPAMTLEAGERLGISLRIRHLARDASTLKLGDGAPDTWKLRRESNGDYWLDIPIEPAGQSSSRTVPLMVESTDGRSREIRVQLMVTVPSENFVVTPRELDFGELNLQGVKTALKRIGVRKLVGSFQLKTVTSTLPFVKIEQATMVAGSNYLIRVTLDPAKPLKPGAHEGVLVIETDEGHRVELPIKMKLVAR
ncbi:MAG: hypothetical protein WAV20_13375 [Blastocatellia bacterium]